MKRQVAELREIQQLEAATKTEMFNSMQAKIQEKDQVHCYREVVSYTFKLIQR
jgi:hypothetical protein